MLYNEHCSQIERRAIHIQSKQEKTKESILKKATDIVFAEGSSSLTMRRLAKDCKLAVGTLYLFFKDKDCLMVEVSQRIFHRAFHIDDNSFHLKNKQSVNFLDVYTRFYKRALSTFSSCSSVLSLADLKFKNDVYAKSHSNWMEHIRQGFLVALAMDLDIREDAFSKTCTKEDFCTWFLRAALFSLSQKEENPQFLFSTINKLLYGGSYASSI